MSQQPPPPPYGGPPGSFPPSGPPYGGPPGAYPQHPGTPDERPRDGMSNTARFWIGAVLALPAAFLAALATSAASALLEAVTGSSEAGATASFVVGLVLLAGYVAAVVWEKTRWFAIGMVAGAAVLLILAAGACVVLLAVLFSGHS